MNRNALYFLNPKTGALHIRGANCPESKTISNAKEAFSCEEDVYRAHGLTFRWCKKCLKWREDLIRQTILHEEERK